MSLDEIDRITRNAEEVRDALEDVRMPYDSAVSIDAKLKVISALVEDVKAFHAEDIKELHETIEGLMANWPHTEIVQHYTPSEQPVLMKEEALRRASILLKSR